MKERKEHPRLGKLTKGLCLTACFLVMIPCLAIAAFGILDLTGVSPFLGEGYRTYTYQFVDVDEQGQTITLFQDSKKRGEKWTEYTTKPTKEDHTFLGWDIDGNNIVDTIPERAYFSFTAKAVYLRNNISGENDEEIWGW